MAAIRGNRISTLLPYRHAWGWPSFDIPELKRRHSAGSSITSDDEEAFNTQSRIEREKNRPGESRYSKKEKELRARILKNEECIVSRSAGICVMDVLYFVDVPRDNESARTSVEVYLDGLGIVPPEFDLTAASNLVALERSYAITLKKFGFFAITPAKRTLEAMIAKVDEQNRIWQERKGGYRRYFDLSEPCFSTAEYELVVLYPRHAFPMGQTTSTLISQPIYYVASDGALRENEDPSSNRMPGFCGPNGRDNEKGECLNPFLVAINAEMVFRRFRREQEAMAEAASMSSSSSSGDPASGHSIAPSQAQTLCAEYEELVCLTLELADRIYYPPLVDEVARGMLKTKAIWGDSIVGLINENESSAENNEDDDSEDSSSTASGATVMAGPSLPDIRDNSVKDRNLRRNTRLGYVVEDPGPRATPEHALEYMRYLMSATDHDYDSGDDDLLDEIWGTVGKQSS